MTIKEKQWQLYYLGYYGNDEKDIDGIWGEKSRGATRKFQVENGLTMDGIFGPLTEAKSKEIIELVQKVISPYAVNALNKNAYGLAGPKTIAATAEFQQHNGLKVTGRADKETIEAARAALKELGIEDKPAVNQQKPVVKPEADKVQNDNWWDNIAFFTREEFRCKCGGKFCNGFPAEPNQLLVEIADDVRRHFGAAASVSSGLRCKVHNANCGGATQSRHMTGKAMDFKIAGHSAAQVLAYVQKNPKVRYSYDINGTYLHMDVM